MIRAAAFGLVALMSQATAADVTYQTLEFEDLAGWIDDDHAQAFSVFGETCDFMDQTIWKTLCGFAQTDPDPRRFFEIYFKPVLIDGATDALFTGYYEPELKGSRQPDATFRYPIYQKPPDLPADKPWFTRGEIETSGVIDGKGLEIAYLADTVERYFLHIQGSGRIALENGESIRVGYAGKNGHAYTSVGKEMVRDSLFDDHEVSAATIGNWVRANPADGPAFLRRNKSFVFFHELRDVPVEKGPLGAMNRSITSMRSIAIDPEFIPLGAPVWIEKGGADPLKRLMVAQDTGAAIKGAQRADIFYGTGAEAGKTAGTIKDAGRVIVLLPIQMAHALTQAG